MKENKHRFFGVRNTLSKPNFKDMFRKALAKEVER